MNNPITLARTCVALYAVIVIAIAFFVIPRSDRTKHFTARRYLGANTRLSENLLVKPRDISVEESYRLNQELETLKGKYIKRDVEAMKAVTPDNVTDSPIVAPNETFPVWLDAEPDWMFLNQGSLVQVWIANNPTPQRAVVLAILPSGNQKWVALLKRQDLSAVLAGSKDPHVLRLEVMAGTVTAPTPGSSPSPIPSPTQWAAPSLSPSPK